MIEVDDGEHENLSSRFTGLSIAAQDVHAEYRRLRERGVPFIEPPERQPWGGTLAHFTDPSGNLVGEQLLRSGRRHRSRWRQSALVHPSSPPSIAAGHMDTCEDFIVDGPGGERRGLVV